MKTSHRSDARRKRRYSPQFDQLEGRWCPAAASASVSVLGHAMLIRADNNGDTITVTDDGAGHVAATVASSGGTTLASGQGANINAVLISGGAGSDSIKYTLTAVLTTDRAINVSPSQGNDQVTLDFSAGATGTVKRLTHLFIGTEGGSGANQVTTKLGALTNTLVNVGEYLGKGATSATVNFTGAITGSHVGVEADGGKGNETLNVNVSGGAITNSDLGVVAYMGDGADAFSLAFSDSLVNSRVGFIANGGPAADTLTAALTQANIDAKSSLSLQLLGGFKGGDTTKFSYEGVVNGKLNLESRGGSTANNESGTIILDQGSTGKLTSRVVGGKGNDTLSLAVTDNSGGPGGKSTMQAIDALVDGGGGTDTITTSGPVKVKK